MTICLQSVKHWMIYAAGPGNSSSQHPTPFWWRTMGQRLPSAIVTGSMLYGIHVQLFTPNCQYIEYIWIPQIKVYKSDISHIVSYRAFTPSSSLFASYSAFLNPADFPKEGQQRHVETPCASKRMKSPTLALHFHFPKDTWDGSDFGHRHEAFTSLNEIIRRT